MEQAGSVHQHDLAIADGDVAATAVQAENPSGAGVLLVHGLGSDRRTNIERARALTAAHATTCLAIDLRGHGDSVGRLSTVTPEQNLADVLAGYDALAGLPGVDPGRVAVCGASYGAYLSVLATAQRPVARLVLRAPALYRDDVAGSTLSQRRAGDQVTARCLLAALASSSMPALLVESECDEVIPHEVVDTYVAARPDIEHAVLTGAGHALTDPVSRAQYQRLLVEFFRDL
jgi:pimeloyl-ACP methyl ester carboxylesterase